MQPIDVTWAGGEHPFLLNIELLRALQDKCDAGPQWVLARLRTGQWYVDDVLSPLRLGLEGGGMDKEEARKLVRRYVEDEPLAESVLAAVAVLSHSLYGVLDEDNSSGEASAAAETK